MTSFDPDETLRTLRRSVLKWEQEPPGSVAESDAAEAATSAAAALDVHLTKGGALPASWANVQPPTGGLADPGYCTHGADCKVHPDLGMLHGDIPFGALA